MVKPTTYSIPSTFYEARFGVEIFVELYDSTLLSPVSSYMLKRYITFYFVDFAVIVYCYYGYLPILQHIDFHLWHISLIYLILKIVLIIITVLLWFTVC